jgi:hypothetical protein
MLKHVPTFFCLFVPLLTLRLTSLRLGLIVIRPDMIGRIAGTMNTTGLTVPRKMHTRPMPKPLTTFSKPITLSGAYSSSEKKLKPWISLGS